MENNYEFGKHKIELNKLSDGRTFLNYWDWAHGQDVSCQIIDNKLMLSQYDEESNELPAKEIDFTEFLRLVNKSISEINI